MRLFLFLAAKEHEKARKKKENFLAANNTNNTNYFLLFSFVLFVLFAANFLSCFFVFFRG